MPRLRMIAGAALAASALAACSTTPADRQARIDQAAADAVKAAELVRATYCAAVTPEARAELARKATGQATTIINCP